MFNGERLAELRKDKNLTQKELATQLGVTRNKLSDYERGVNAPPDHFKLSVARFFDISLDYLMELTDVEASYKRAGELVIFPKEFPEALLPEVQRHIDLLNDSHLYHSGKK